MGRKTKSSPVPTMPASPNERIPEYAIVPVIDASVFESNGRTYGISHEQAKVVLEAIRKGNFPKISCQLAGVNWETFCRWMEKGAGDDAGEPYKSFCAAVRGAEAMAESGAVASLMDAFDRDWRSAAFFLERKNPKEWSPKQAGVQLGVQGGNVVISLPDNGRDGLIEPLSVESSTQE